MPRALVRLLILVVVLLAATPSLAQDWRGRGSLRGQVTDSSGQPLAGVEIGARLEADGETLFTVTTNDRGRFTMVRMRTGPWVLHIEHAGYEPLQQGATAVATRSGDPLIVMLTKLPERALAAVDVEEANEALLSGDWEQARSSYEAALEKLTKAEHPPILLGIARTHMNEQDTTAAREVLERALAIDPESIEAARLLASALSADGDVEAAQELLARFESIEPDFNTLVGIGVSSYNAGDIETAREHFDRAIAQQPDQAYAYYYRGLCFLSSEDSPAAIADFERFLELMPDAEEATEVESYLDFLRE